MRYYVDLDLEDMDTLVNSIRHIGMTRGALSTRLRSIVERMSVVGPQPAFFYNLKPKELPPDPPRRVKSKP